MQKFLINILFPIQDKIKNWNIEDTLGKITKTNLLAAACNKYNNLIEDDSIFPIIIKTMRVGSVRNYDQQWIIATINDSTPPTNSNKDFTIFSAMA